MTKIRLLLITAFVLTGMYANAQMVELPLTFTNVTPIDQKSFQFTFAADPKGSSELDTILSEREIPSVPPPAGVYFVYTVPPSSEYLWLSPKDIRKLRGGVHFREDYDVYVLWTGGQLDVTWPSTLPPLVDSAYLTDAWSDFPDNFNRVKIEPGKSFTTDNPAMTRLKVLVWYNGTTTAVDQYIVGSLAVFPNPATEAITITGLDVGARVSLISTQGSEMMFVVGHGTECSMDISGLPMGLYIAKVDYLNGRTNYRSFIRL